MKLSTFFYQIFQNLASERGRLVQTLRSSTSFSQSSKRARIVSLSHIIVSFLARLARDRRLIHLYVLDLTLLLVDPKVQRSGAGSALLHHLLGLADESQCPVYLDATPAGTTLYERTGFAVFGETISAKDFRVRLRAPFLYRVYTDWLGSFVCAMARCRSLPWSDLRKSEISTISRYSE